MNRNGQPPDPTPEELCRFREDVKKITPEELLPYSGKQVAWSIDSARIVASADEGAELEDMVVAAGVAPNRVVFGFIEDPNVSYLF